MCTFLSSLPKSSKTAGTKNTNKALYLKPCQDTKNEKVWYRFRLLNFAAQNSDRDYPFIQRYVHQIWKKNEKGFSEVESEVVCPVTKWMDWDGDRYDCQICKFANQQYNTLKETGWKDADARKKNKEFSRKFQAIIPIYIVNDPNYDGNNGKFRVLILNDKKFYDEIFIKKIEKQLMTCNCFNGINAADICMHVSDVANIINEGQPNQYTWHQRVIDKICFSKPYDLPAITKEAVDSIKFDETYYVSSTKNEIDEFYNRYIKISNNDIIEDEDEDDIKIFDSSNKDIAAVFNNKDNNLLNIKNSTEEQNVKSQALDDKEIDDLIDTPIENNDDSKLSVENKESLDIDDKSIDDLLNDIGF